MPEPDSLSTKGSALFETLIATAVDGIIVIDAYGTVQIYNSACERLFGYPGDEVIGQNVKMLMPDPYQSGHDRYLETYRRTGERRVIGIGREALGRRKDGTTFPVYLSVGEGNIDDQKVFVGIIHDLTALRSESEKREASDRHLADIVESSGDVILSKTLDGTVTSWNAAAERIFGYTAAEIVGHSISLIVPDDRRAEEEDILRRIHAGERIQNFETIRRRKDGSPVTVSLTISPVRDADGKIVGASKIGRDVTAQRLAELERARLQAELLHVSRLNAMGQMTAAIAHELNQPLTAVTNYVNAAKRTLAPLSDDNAVLRAQDMMDRASAQTLRAGNIIRNLRDFVEKREGERTPQDLNRVVDEAIAMSFLGTDSDVRVRLRLDRDLAPVMIDRVQIQQVLLNLFRNSIEAMASSPKRELHISTGLDGEGYAGVTIADTGPGLSPDVLSRLFQPFITTKPTGMGMGLTISQSIVDSHNGRIWHIPAWKNGTAFRIRLPLAELHEEEA